MGKLIAHLRGKVPELAAEEKPSFFVIQASIVALTGLADIYLPVQRVYQATVKVEQAANDGDLRQMFVEMEAWNRLFKLAGQAVFTASGGTFQTPEVASE